MRRKDTNIPSCQTLHWRAWSAPSRRRLGNPAPNAGFPNVARETMTRGSSTCFRAGGGPEAKVAAGDAVWEPRAFALADLAFSLRSVCVHRWHVRRAMVFVVTVPIVRCACNNVTLQLRLRCANTRYCTKGEQPAAIAQLGKFWKRRYYPLLPLKIFPSVWEEFQLCETCRANNIY